MSVHKNNYSLTVLSLLTKQLKSNYKSGDGEFYSLTAVGDRNKSGSLVLQVN